MSELRLYVDEDAEETAVVRGLRSRGVDVVTAADVNLHGVEDAEQLAFAVNQSRTIYTLNVGDFARLHYIYLRSGKSHSGIIVIPERRYSIGEKIRRIAELVARVSSEEIINRMEYL